MQIVIDIPEEEYAAICYNVLNEREHSYGYVAIANGKPLPKGHGRLIDADAIESILHNRGFDKAKSVRFYEIVWAQKQVHNAPTVIEADKEVDNADSN